MENHDHQDVTDTTPYMKNNNRPPGDTVHPGGRFYWGSHRNRWRSSHSFCCSPLLLQAQCQSFLEVNTLWINKHQYSNPTKLLSTYTSVRWVFACMCTRLFWLVYNPPSEYQTMAVSSQEEELCLQLSSGCQSGSSYSSLLLPQQITIGMMYIRMIPTDIRITSW